MIKDKDIPLKYYNYSYIKDLLETKYYQKVSLPTIIDRAKKHDFYLKKKPRKNSHDREVLTNYIGEVIQHDSSYHLWSPPAKEKCYPVEERNLLGSYPCLTHGSLEVWLA